MPTKFMNIEKNYRFRKKITNLKSFTKNEIKKRINEKGKSKNKNKRKKPNEARPGKKTRKYRPKKLVETSRSFPKLVS